MVDTESKNPRLRFVRGLSCRILSQVIGITLHYGSVCAINTPTPSRRRPRCPGPKPLYHSVLFSSSTIMYYLCVLLVASLLIAACLSSHRLTRPRAQARTSSPLPDMLTAGISSLFLPVSPTLSHPCHIVGLSVPSSSVARFLSHGKPSIQHRYRQNCPLASPLGLYLSLSVLGGSCPFVLACSVGRSVSSYSTTNTNAPPLSHGTLPYPSSPPLPNTPFFRFTTFACFVASSCTLIIGWCVRVVSLSLRFVTLSFAPFCWLEPHAALALTCPVRT